MRTIKTLIVGAAVVGSAAIANAIPALYISTTGAAGSYTEVATSASGLVTYSTTSGPGVWTIQIDSGETKPVLSTATSPAMDLGIIASSTGVGSLYVAFEDIGFDTAAIGELMSIGGHIVSGAAETYSFESFADTANTQATTTLPTGSVLGSPLTGSFSSTTSGGSELVTLPNSSAYALGVIVEITAAGATSTSIDASLEPVPDGGATALLLGAALSGLALLKRKLTA